MTSSTNRQIILAARPKGYPTADVFSLRTEAIPVCQSGEVLVRTLYLSVDPYMRGRMNDVKSYVPPFEVGAVLTGGVVGQVEESRHDAYAVGDIVFGDLGWQDYSVSQGKGLRKLNPVPSPLSAALGVLGLTGLTAYFGLLSIGAPKPGETVVVSGAAGAVGLIVGQLAKIKGCRVVGIAGSDDKTKALVDEYGFDAAVNYKSPQGLREELRAACPDGVDIYFDNVGGDVTDAVIRLLNNHARIPLCGQIAMYNYEKPDVGPRNWSLLIGRRVLVKGFIVSDYAKDFPQAIAELTGYVGNGSIRARETIVEGLENAPDAFLGLFRGDNFGKQIVHVSDPM